MLSEEENEILTRVGPGTPMGGLLRQYWIPALISSELPEPDGAPLRLRLLGEDLIAFRDSDGRVGLLGNSCSHRGASLFFGRNEEGGLRCVYHGWKYDVAGHCVDMPNEPPESNFKDKILHQAYPCQEKGGVVWTYLGPRAEPPSLPGLEWLTLPEDHLSHSKMLRECNFVQAMEGDIDSSHTSFLHSSLQVEPGRGGDDSRYAQFKHGDRSPRLDVVWTDYGVMYGSRRNADPDSYYWRIAQFLMPFFTMIPPIGQRMGVGTRIWVPVDDEHVMYWSVSGNLFGPVAGQRGNGNLAASAGEYLPHTTDWLGRWRLAANQSNDYFIDRVAQRTRNYTGIEGTNLQDQAITESMGPIYDRTQEHLGSSDAMIIQVRKRLIDAARALQNQGTPPPGADDPSLYWVRPASIVLPRDVSWLEGAQEHLAPRLGVPLASV